MKRALYLLFFGISFVITSNGQESSTAGDLFTAKCGICHKIGGGKFIGPDLINVTENRSEEWLMDFIRSSQKMIKSGDPESVALFEEYNKVIMPDPMISDDEIRSLLGYIAESSAGGGVAEKTYTSIIENATAEDLAEGEELFEGKMRFKNGGPSCISCHNDLSGYAFSENSYSTKDISESFRTLGEAGVKAILENPPFPVMKTAFEGKELEADEVHDLLVFLKDSRASKASPPTTGYFIYGLCGALLLLFIYAGLWHNRKGGSVNEKLFKRQIGSIN